MKFFKEPFLLFIFSLFFCFSFFAFFHNQPIHPDEAYYWVWSKNLAINYFDHGPGIAYWIRFFTILFGDTQTALLAAAVSGLFILMNATYLLAKECGFSWQLGVLTTMAVLTTPGFFIGSTLITPDTGMISFGTLALFFFARYINRQNIICLLLTFFFAGIALLFKLSILSFGIAAFFWILIFEPQIFKRFSFYFGILIAMITISPLVIGNLEFHQAKLTHYSSLFNAQTFFLGKMLVGQIIALSLPWFFLITTLLFMVIRHFLSQNFFVQPRNSIPKIWKYLQENFQKEKIIVLLWMNFIVLQVIASILSFDRDIQINWLFPSYTSALLLCVYYLFHKPVKSNGNSAKQKLSKKNEKWKRKIGRIIFSLGFLVCLVSNAFILYGQDLALALGWRKMPTQWIVKNRLLGFTEIINEYHNYQKKLPEPNEWTLAAPRYQDAAISSWYLRDKIFVQSLQLFRKDQYGYLNMNSSKIKNKIFIIALAAYHEEKSIFDQVERKLNLFCRPWYSTDIKRIRNSHGEKIRSGKFYYCHQEK